MPFTIDDDVSPTYIVINMLGLINDDTLTDYLAEIFLIPGFPTKDQLVDYSSVTEYRVSSQGLADFSAAVVASESERNARTDRRIACVVPEDITFGMGRVFLVQIDNLPASYKIFRTRPEALAWLNL
ncbi:MAG: hypothetical protein HOC23_05760 [Halieaceae bacterium]|jgi:hypothetical protein|nr:hypothetical protein [Halieaceae bacterium]